MWPFRRKGAGLSGSQVGRKGNGTCVLTAEEQRYVDKEFQLFKDYAVHEQVKGQFRRLVMARGLARYANTQITIAGVGSGEGRQREPVERAIAAISRAYSLCCLPIYLYDMATFVEMTGKLDTAQNLFEAFVEQQATFEPDQIEAAFLRERDIEEAVRDASRRIELSADEQYARSAVAAPAAGTTAICGRCGGEVEPQATSCERCGWERSAGRASSSPPQPIGLSPDLGDGVTRRSAGGGNTRLVLGVISVVVLVVVSALAVIMGLARYGIHSDKAKAAAYMNVGSEGGGQALKLRAGNPTAEEVAPLLDAERAHTAILEGAADLRKWLARESPNDPGYKTMIQVALDDMSRAVAAQLAAEDGGRHPPRGKAYRAWLECVGAEIDAFIERYNRGDIGRGPAAKKEALAPLDAAVAGYDAAYQGALAMPSASKSEPVAPHGENRDKDLGGPERPAQGPEGEGQGPAADQTSPPEHPEEGGNTGERQPEAAPDAGSEAPQASPAPEQPQG